MRGRTVILAALLLLTYMAVYCEDSDVCPHSWRHADESYDEAMQEVKIQRTQFVDCGEHHARVNYLMKQCDLCGVQQTFPDAIDEPHMYAVETWSVSPDSADIVFITYECEWCEHIRIEPLSLSALRSVDPASTQIDCLHGGACPLVGGRYSNTETGYLYIDDGRFWFLTRVLIEEDGREVWKVARRLECWTCGRPTIQYRNEFDETWENYSLLPSRTYDEFMTENDRTDLPYQLIDQLREEAGAA